MLEPHALDYNEFSEEIIEILKSRAQWHRVVSIDLETKIEKKSDFLTGERLLGIGLARRVRDKVETRAIWLKDESDEAEVELLNEAARWLAPIRPLALVGYNIAGYDYPLLNMKLKWYDDYHRKGLKEGERAAYPREYWALKDALTRAYILDMMHPLRYAVAEHDKTTAKYRSLADVVEHARFADAALMRRKQLAAGTSTEHKGKVIYDLWKSKDPNFERYLEGDVHDVLVLAEHLYGLDGKG